MRRVLIGIALAGLVGCTHAANLRDQFRVSDCHLPFDQRLRFEKGAPIIVLGRVLEVNEIGQPQQSSADPRIKTQLTRIKIDVEVVIKGEVRSSSIEFYYFMFSAAASEVDLGAPRYLPAVDQRRIYFLKPSGGSYRSVGDVTDYTLRVSSGSHTKGFCKGKSPGSCIAEKLLVPQQEIDIRWFVADLIQSEYAAEVLCSRRTAQDLMQRLTQHPDRRIADAAREVIAGTRSPR
jgi:hypothetical protein